MNCSTLGDEQIEDLTPEEEKVLPRHGIDFEEIQVTKTTLKVALYILTNTHVASHYFIVMQAIDAKIRQWSNGKQGNIRSLLSTLQYVSSNIYNFNHQYFPTS